MKLKTFVSFSCATSVVLLSASWGPVLASQPSQAVKDREGNVIKLIDENGHEVARQHPDPPSARIRDGLTFAGNDVGARGSDGIGHSEPYVVHGDLDGLGYGSSSDAWGMYQGNSRHTGYLPISLEPDVFSLRWQRMIGPGNALNPPTAADGKVFVSLLVYFDDIPALFALDARDGEMLWSKGYGSIFSVNPPSYAYGNVYVQTGNHSSDTFLHAYEADTGAPLFEVHHSAQWERYYAPTIFDGTVYVNGGSYGGMYAFDALSGAQTWFRSLPQYDQWTPGVDGGIAFAYVGEYDPGLYALDRFTGDLLFMIPDPSFDWDGWSMNSAPVLGDDDDVLAIHDGRLIRFDIQDQSIRWELDRAFTGEPSVAKNVIYAIDDGSLVAQREDTGEDLWSWRPPSGVLSSNLIVTDSHVLVSSSSTVFAVELASRASVWSFSAGGHLALGDETLYIASENGTLTAISVPEYIPATLTKLEISGPSEVVESSTAQYKAMAFYDDGRVRDRSQLAQWSVAPSSFATFDENGTLTTKELFQPVQHVVVRATYDERGVHVADELAVDLVIGVSLRQFVERNLIGAMQTEARVFQELEIARAREQAARSVLSDLFATPMSEDPDSSATRVIDFYLRRAIRRTVFAEGNVALSFFDLRTVLEKLKNTATSTAPGER